MNLLQDDPKRARILDGALKVFLAYGFSRSTMDDIARAAEMSRPALYLLFKNKTEIYRAIAASLLDNSVDQARIALEQPGTFAARMMLAIENSMISMMETIANAPHGAEMLDMKSTLASDLFEDWRAGLGKHMAHAIADEARRLGVDLAERGVAAEALADMLLDGLEATKHRIPGLDAKRQSAKGLVRIVELALRP